MSTSQSDTIRAVIDRMASRQGSSVFLFAPETQQEVTFADLQRQSNELAQRLFSLGLRKGDKVALVLDNGLFSAGLLLGAMYAGLVPVPLNVRSGKAHLAYALNHCDARLVFVSAEYASTVDEILDQVERELQVIRADEHQGPQWGGPVPSIDSLPHIHPDDDALLIYTSGSTGNPKGVELRHCNVVAAGTNSRISHQISADDRSLCVLPLYHINAPTVTLISSLLAGAGVVMPRKFVVREFWQWMVDYRCTWSALVPAIISQLLDWIDPWAEGMEEGLRQIRFMRSSSAPLTPAMHRAFEERFPILLIEAMGSTEAGGNVFSNPMPPKKNKIGSPGLPWGFEAKVVDPHGADVPPGEPGEIVLRGPSVMKGYYKNPNETAAILSANGWLRTGDLARVDEEGYFFVVGRAKELIIKGGMNIAPRQIDEVLESHPAVLEAAAVGVPDRYLGEDIVAFVVLRVGVSADERQLLAFCESCLGHFKTPSRIQVVKDLPKGPSGKVQRLRLLDEPGRNAAAATTGSSIPSEHGDDQRAHSGSLAAASTIEQMIAKTWAELLGEPQIDVQTNFFALGGDSLLAIRCLSRLREKLRIVVSFSDFFENATVADLAWLVRRRLRLEIAPASETSPDGRADATAGSQSIPQRDKALPCPLSLGQEGLWFLEQLNPGAPVYNEVDAVRWHGELHVDTLERALNTIVARHEVLRSTIQVTEKQPVVIVHDYWPLRFKKIDLSALAADERQAEVERLLVDEPRGPYRLEAEPGIRATLLRLGPREHIFILMMHHIICDRLSIGVLLQELSALYGAFRRGQASPLSPLHIQYGDYAVWQRQQLEKGTFDGALSWWKENLCGAPRLLELATDRPRPPVISYRGSKQWFRLNASLAESLRVLSRREQTSLFTVFAAALNALLYRYTGKEDILVGIPIADRERPELQLLIGFLIETHALRTDLSGNPTFRELLGRVQKGLLGVYDHRTVPFDQVVAAVQPERSLSHAPLFQVALNWRDRDAQMPFNAMEGLAAEPLLAQSGTSKYDLKLALTDAGDEIWLELEYSSDLFDVIRMERLVGHYQTLLEAVAVDPNRSLGDLPLLAQGERQQILEEWNRTEAVYPKDQCVHELIEEQARRTPEAVAVVSKDTQLTYRQLNDRANQLAHHLHKLGVGPDTLVGVCVDRSPEMVVGLLGILKAGGAYIPLDPGYPKERLAFMLHDSGAPVLLTHQSLRDKLQAGDLNCQILCLDADWPRISGSPDENPKSGVKPENLAYVIYTSGSTGEPKGVELMHGGLLNLIFWHRRTYQVTSADKSTQLAGVGFDASVWELWPYLTAGAGIYMPEEDVRLLPEKLRDWLVEQEITLSFVPTPLAERLVAIPWPEELALRAMLTGGDRLTCHVPASLPFPLVNHYGPTESTVVATCAVVDIERQDGKAPPIGRPIANTRVYLLDSHLQPVPIGFPGELHIEGDGLARGYLHRPDLTAEKFIANPLGGKRGARLYKTGDLARYSPSGAIEFLGRNDDQVKIRGFRIELGEIESALAGHPGVGAAVVVPREDGLGEKRLVAYVTIHSPEPTVSEMREHLKKLVPDYMVPSAFVILNQFPLTSNGKVDRAALPAPDSANSLPHEEDAASLTEVEKVVSGIVAAVLGLARVDSQANFFDLGGNSLMGTQLIARIRGAFGIDLPLRKVFQSPTVAELSGEIEQILVEAVEAMEEEEIQRSA